MGPLSQNDCRALLSAVEMIHGITYIDEFPVKVLSTIRKILPCNSMCYNEVALPNSMKSWIMEPADALPGPLLKESFLRNYTEHPVFLHYSRTGDINSYRMSDFLSQRQFHDTVLYNEYYRQSSVEYQLATAFMLGSDLMICIALDRHCKDFSENDCLTLDLLRPHLVQAYYNIQTLELMKGIIEKDGKGLLIVSRSGQVRLASDNAWRVISKYFHTLPLQSSLPDVLNSWITHERTHLDEVYDDPSPPAPLVINKDNHKLTIRFLWGGKSAGQDMLLIEEEPVELTTGFLIDTQLTNREDEILAFLSQGKTNNEIGQALSISSLTVKKHLEHIYSKLQVHRRSAAVARFYQI
jgi:DNA-binding CsgD family transcriptional regulator